MCYIIGFGISLINRMKSTFSYNIPEYTYHLISFFLFIIAVLLSIGEKNFGK